MAQYHYDMTKQFDIDRFNVDMESLGQVLFSKKFKSYIADKCIELLKEICNEATFWEEHEIWSSKVEEYKNGHKVEIGDDYVLVFNDTYYTPDEQWWLSDKTKINYFNGLSVSYLIEYGMGIQSFGANDWETSTKSKWVANNPDGDTKHKWYSSQQGKFIYLKLAGQVEQRMEDWVAEYIGKEFLK